LSNDILPEGWELLSAIEARADTIREEPILPAALQGFALGSEIIARITEGLNNALTNLYKQTPVVSVRILCRCQGKAPVGFREIRAAYQHHRNHWPPDAWNYFIIERKRDSITLPSIELYLFPDR
jgi:hypothetical protein